MRITRLDVGALARALGVVQPESAPRDLLDGIVAILAIEPYILPIPGAVPAPSLLGGLEPQQVVGTGAFNTPGATNRSGVINAWGAGAVVGVDPPNKFSRVAAPPTADYEVWGCRAFLGMARGAIGEFNGILQFTNGTTATEESLFIFATNNHEANANFRADYWQLLGVPYRLAAGRQLFFKWQVNNLSVGAQDYDIQLGLFWKYA